MIMMILKIAGRVLLMIALVVVILAAAVFLFLRFWPSVGKLPNRDEREALAGRLKRYDSGQFHNENEVSTMSGEVCYAGERKTPKTMLPAETPAFLTDPQADDLTFTWFGHSSFLLQMGRAKILADPIFSDRSSPVSFAGPKRFSELMFCTEAWWEA